MNCKLNAFEIYFTLAICLMALAMALASNWPTAFPLFGAAATIALLVSVVIPKMKQALLDYVACRGPSVKCSVGVTLYKIMQVTALLSGIAFALAGALQVTALAFISTFVLAWLGVATSAIVAVLVSSGILICGTAAVILFIIQGQAWAFARCMDEQDVNVGGAGRLSPREVK